ncbi:MAG: hypothetical protein K9W43_05725 [Candidatus Thorarchaeota archaeon]|nr:hypothetical protein [Candidatus Thorarchaeota archaeon]
MSNEIINILMPLSEWPELDRMGAIVNRMSTEKSFIPLTKNEKSEEEE